MEFKQAQCHGVPSSLPQKEKKEEKHHNLWKLTHPYTCESHRVHKHLLNLQVLWMMLLKISWVLNAKISQGLTGNMTCKKDE